MEDAFDQYQVCVDYKGDGGAAFETDRSKAGQDFVAPSSPIGKQVELLAMGDDPADIVVRGAFACLFAKIIVQVFKLAYGGRREDDTHAQEFAAERPRRLRR